jgi:hypothetical protein
MKIIHKNVLLSSEDTEVIQTPYLKIENVGDNCLLSMFNAGGSGEQLLVKPEDFPAESRTPVFWSRSGRGFILRPDATRWRDLQNYLAYFDGCRDGAIGTICKIDGELYLLFTVPMLVTGFVPQQGDGNESSIETLNKIVPGYTQRQVVKEERAKADLMREINPVDILSDLEKQVDLLTALVVALADVAPAGSLPSWFDAFKAVHVANTSTQFKGAEGALLDIAATKSKIRGLQTSLYSVRNAGQ